MKIDWPHSNSLQVPFLYPKHIFYSNWAKVYLKNIYILTTEKPDLLKNSILQKPTLKFNKNLEKGGNFGRCKKRNEEQWRSKVTIKLLGFVWVNI